MQSYQMLAAPPWHWWIAVNLLIVDGILLIALGTLYYKIVVAPARSMRRDPAVQPSHEGVLEKRRASADDVRRRAVDVAR